MFWSSAPVSTDDQKAKTSSGIDTIVAMAWGLYLQPDWEMTLRLLFSHSLFKNSGLFITFHGAGLHIAHAPVGAWTQGTKREGGGREREYFQLKRIGSCSCTLVSSTSPFRAWWSSNVCRIRIETRPYNIHAWVLNTYTSMTAYLYIHRQRNPLAIHHSILSWCFRAWCIPWLEFFLQIFIIWNY